MNLQLQSTAMKETHLVVGLPACDLALKLLSCPVLPLLLLSCPVVDASLLTARSLCRAAEGVVCAEVLVDASRPCEGDTWQALFRWGYRLEGDWREFACTWGVNMHTNGVEDTCSQCRLAASGPLWMHPAVFLLFYQKTPVSTSSCTLWRPTQCCLLLTT
jgi:hypothetical protein